ncbi:archaetidylserine synthase [Methanobacterium sp. ACI-7]|uniref:archaetidylserine synthase n=1 Tax=unclassified Methanobacterium TaxID=2627676 RepID=UPI0039C020F4
MNIRSYTSIADLVSIANASSGFLSIIMITMGNFALAAKFMLLAVIFNAMDGWVARKLNREDEVGFGKNIDSLSDIISFGVAPGMLLYSTTMNFGIPYFGIIISLLIVICGILRLSRFNVITDLSDEKFIGLPIPSTALILGSFYLSGLYNSDLALFIMMIVSLLMISTIEYPKFRGIKTLVVGGILIITALLPQSISSIIANFPTKLLFILMLLYLLAIPIIDLYTRFLKSGPHVR